MLETEDQYCIKKPIFYHNYVATNGLYLFLIEEKTGILAVGRSKYSAVQPCPFLGKCRLNTGHIEWWQSNMTGTEYDNNIEVSSTFGHNQNKTVDSYCMSLPPGSLRRWICLTSCALRTHILAKEHTLQKCHTQVSELTYRCGRSLIKFVFRNHAVCVGSGVLIFQAPFCVYTMVIIETPYERWNQSALL